MKSNIRSIVYITIILIPLLGKQVSGQNPLPFKFQNYNTSVVDTFFLNEILDSILSTQNNLHLSIKYAEMYESLCLANPEIPNKLKRVIFLKGNRYNYLAWNNNQNNLDLALKYIDTALYYHKQLESKTGYWNDQYGLGVIYRNKGDNNKALQYFNEFHQYHSDPFDSIKVANVLFQKCAVYMQLGELEKATENIVEAIRIEEALGRDYSLGSNYNVLAIIKRKALLYDEVLPIYQKALQIRKIIGDKEGESYTLNNMGNFLAQQGNPKQALIYFKEGEIAASGYKNSLSYIYEGIGRIFLEEKNIDSSQYYLSMSYELRNGSGSERDIYIIQHLLGTLESLKKNYNIAGKFYSDALKVAQKQGEIQKIGEISLDYSKSLENQGKYKQALTMTHLYIEARDSLLNKEIVAKVQEIDTRYQTEKKEQEIALLNSQNNLKDTKLNSSRITMLILMIGILILSALLYRLYQLNKKVIKSESEKDTLLREIHHRVKNNLQVISALLTLQSKHVKDDVAFEALQEGQGRVQSMALIHQDLYQHENLKGVDTKDYFEKLIQNLVDTYKTDDRNIELHGDIQSMILDVDTMIPLGLVVNELTTNALKHAFNNKINGSIRITLQEVNNQLLLKVVDNGLGVEPIQLENKSFGFSLIKSFARRLDAVLDIKNENGLSVELLINNYQKAA